MVVSSIMIVIDVLLIMNFWYGRKAARVISLLHQLFLLDKVLEKWLVLWLDPFANSSDLLRAVVIWHIETDIMHRLCSIWEPFLFVFWQWRTLTPFYVLLFFKYSTNKCFFYIAQSAYHCYIFNSAQAFWSKKNGSLPSLRNNVFQKRPYYVQLHITVLFRNMSQTLLGFKLSGVLHSTRHAQVWIVASLKVYVRNR